MRHPRFFVRFRARLHGDERGFGLLETVIAITVIFGSLTALAYTATIGFKYMAFARERQAAVGVTNMIMEDIRGLAYSKIQKGLLATDLGADPNILNCSGVYRFQSCTPGSDGVGDRIVNASSLPATEPLVPHQGTTTATPASAGYSIAYQWAVYVTNEDPATAPYRVTVLVTWTSPRLNAGLAKTVQTQSLFWSPTGCVSPNTHPFAAPCQPFFFGQALVPRGRVDVSGSIEGLTFTTGALLMTGAESNGQQEQVSQVQGDFTATGTTVTDGSGTQDGGGTTSSTTAADGDPTGATPTYSTVSLPAGAGGTLASSSGSTSIEFVNAAGDTARSDSTVVAGGTNVCPPPTAPAETDNQLCGGSRIQQAGTLSAILHPHGIAPDLGDANLALIAAAANNPNTTFLNRVLVSGQDGYLQQTVVRRIGTFNLAGLPQNFAGPAGWTGYLVTMTNYADTTVAAGGTSSPATTATVSSGSISYWDGTRYRDLSPGSSSVPIPFAPVSVTRMISGHTVTIDVGGSLTTGGATTTCDVSCSGTTTRKSATAKVGSPVTGALTYTITIDGVTKVSLEILVDFGTITSKAVYQSAPTPG